MDRNNRSIVSFLCYHLQLLYVADSVLRIEYDDLGSFYICKSCKCSFSCIPGCCSQNDDLILHLIFLCRSSQKVRKNGKCHIFECDRCSVEQFQIISILHLRKRCNLFGIKLTVVSLCDTALQLFFCKVCQEFLHNCICGLLIGHLFELTKRHRKLRNRNRYK